VKEKKIKKKNEQHSEDRKEPHKEK
jgi:hypothetical protein